MNTNSVTYAELLSNILKRFLLLCGKLAGYKGFAVLVATVLLKSGYIGETACASVSVRGGANAGKRAVKEGKQRIRDALERARQDSRNQDSKK